jgi:hypothetical protein
MAIPGRFGLSNPRRAIAYALLLLGAGFVWAALAANVPLLRNARSIPLLARNWAIALPVFLLWTVSSYVLARRYLTLSGGGGAEGLRLGLVFAAAAFLFDAVVVAGFVGQGWRHFEQPILWIAYGLLAGIPFLVGRAMGS